MDESQFLQVFKPYYEAFAEYDEAHRMQLLHEAMTPDAEIWGPKRLFAGYEQISEKITGFHNNLPGCRLVLDSGLNIFLNSACVGGAIVGPDGGVRARGEAVIELASDGRIQRVLPFWEPLPHFPLRGLARLPDHLATAARPNHSLKRSANVGRHRHLRQSTADSQSPCKERVH